MVQKLAKIHVPGPGSALRHLPARVGCLGCGSLLALRRPVLAVADRASSIAPIGVQFVKYVLHLLSGIAACPGGRVSAP